jgi:type IV pilus assembly protein PilA
MTSKIKRLAAREDGFTLVELLVVILIIGILIAIALPTFLNQQNKAHDSAAQQKLNTAYKVAKSEETSNQGSFTDTGAPGAAVANDGTLGGAIVGSEPELGGVTVVSAANWAANSDASTTGVYLKQAANGSTNLDLGAKSNSSTKWYLHVANNGAPTTNNTP